MIITYLVFGENNSIFCQAVFSMLTMLAKKEDNDTIAVVTDNPDKFNFLKEKITILIVNEETLTNWKGESNFFWRIKIKALQFISSKFENRHILYVDSDTFLFGTFDIIRRDLNDHKNVMHTNEGRLSRLKTKTERRMWRQLKNKTYRQIKISSTSCMWNAGVIGISKTNSHVLDLTLDICDQMCADNVTRRLIEQFAFSVALNHASNLIPAENEIGHYWGNKEIWNQKINEFINDCFMRNLSLEQQIQKASTINFEEIPIRIKAPNTRRRLKRKLDKIFPNKETVYIPKTKR